MARATHQRQRRGRRGPGSSTWCGQSALARPHALPHGGPWRLRPSPSQVRSLPERPLGPAPSPSSARRGPRPPRPRTRSPVPALAFHAFRTAWEGLGRRGLASLGWLGVAVPETFERSRPHSRTALCRREAPPRPTRSGFPPALRLVSEHAVASRAWERSRPPRYLTSHRLIPPNPLFSVGRAGSCPFFPLACRHEQVTRSEFACQSHHRRSPGLGGRSRSSAGHGPDAALFLGVGAAVSPGCPRSALPPRVSVQIPSPTKDSSRSRGHAGDLASSSPSP